MCLYGYVKGEVERIDNHTEGFVQQKESRLSQLVEIHGVDKTVVGVANFMLVMIDLMKRIYGNGQRNGNGLKHSNVYTV
jgi:hypothetical protein